MMQIIRYQKHDSLGKIMFKLEDAKEKRMFVRKEKVLIVVYVVLCLANAGIRVVYSYSIVANQNSLNELMEKILSISEFFNPFLMSIILVLLLSQLSSFHEQQFK